MPLPMLYKNFGKVYNFSVFVKGGKYYFDADWNFDLRGAANFLLRNDNFQFEILRRKFYKNPARRMAKNFSRCSAELAIHIF